MKLDAFEFVNIPAQSFEMGSSPEEIEACVREWAPRLLDAKYDTKTFRSWLLKESPKHAVELKAYAIGKYPVTNAQYSLFIEETGARAPESLKEADHKDHPVWGVELEEARRFARWAGARLPSEAEWELAARGPERRIYPYGDHFDSCKANTFESGIGHTTPVNRYEAFASPYGVVDLAGNVEEWVDTPYVVYPGGQVVRDDLLVTLGEGYPILRGGSFVRGGDLARGARRHGPFKSDLYRYTGFRLARSLQ